MYCSIFVGVLHVVHYIALLEAEGLITALLDFFGDGSITSLILIARLLTLSGHPVFFNLLHNFFFHESCKK